jgi:hypothetical protein
MNILIENSENCEEDIRKINIKNEIYNYLYNLTNCLLDETIFKNIFKNCCIVYNTEEKRFTFFYNIRIEHNAEESLKYSFPFTLDKLNNIYLEDFDVFYYEKMKINNTEYITFMINI